MSEKSPSGRQKLGESPPRAKKPSPSEKAGRSKGKRRRLSAAAITEAAIRIADADGLDAVSIRRVAAELDARPMSLYTHIASKDDLLVAMTEAVNAEMLVQQPLPDDWREAVAVIARRMYAAFVAHPWSPLIHTHRPSFGPNATRLAKQMARAVASLSLQPAEIWTFQGTVSDYVVGHAFRRAAPSSEMAEEISKSDVVEFPELAALGDSLKTRGTPERFELGLQIVLDGVERRVLGNS